MATPSPTDFLTFNRRIVMNPQLRRSVLSSRPAASARPLHVTYARPFSLRTSTCKELSTDDSVKTDKYPDGEHATRKREALDPQSKGAKEAQHAKATGTGGHATEQKDSAGGKERAKREFPEAPDPAIGMQDERGGRGGR